MNRRKKPKSRKLAKKYETETRFGWKKNFRILNLRNKRIIEICWNNVSKRSFWVLLWFLSRIFFHPYVSKLPNFTKIILKVFLRRFCRHLDPSSLLWIYIQGCKRTCSIENLLWMNFPRHLSSIHTKNQIYLMI